MAHPGLRLAAAGDSAAHDDRHDQVTREAAGGVGRLGAAGLPALGDNPLRTLPTGELEELEGLGDSEVAETTGEDDGVLDGEGGPLAGSRRGRVCGVSDQYHAPAVPAAHGRHVVRRPSAQGTGRALDQGDRWGPVAALEGVEP